MLDAMRAFDWGSTPAGPIASWAEPLKHAARLMMLGATPMALLLGREGLLAYNDAMRELFGDHYDGSLARPVEDVLPEAASFYREAIDRCFAGQGCRFLDQPLRLYRDGEWKAAWFNLSFMPVADVEGFVSGVLVIVSETTARVKALRELDNTRKRLEVALDASGMVGTWDIDVATNRLTGDERFARLFDISAEECFAGVDNDLLVDLVHPDDRESVRVALERSMETGADYHCRYRLLTAKGQRWFLDAGRALRDKDGRVEKLTGIVVDLTEQVSIEEALYQSEARFRALVESIPQIVWSTDAGGRHDYFNSRWTEFTGLDPNAVAPDEWQRLVHPDDWPLVAQTWEECLATGVPYDIEYRFRHYSGEYRWLRVMALPLHDREGTIARWYGTSTDIEDQKRLVDESELVANELEHRIRNLFALVNGLVALSVRENPDVAPIAADFQERLSALHRAHGLIRTRGRAADHLPTSIQALVGALLEPYDDGQGRIVIGGDDLDLAEAMVTPLALVFHELASNSAKYGALAVRTGVLSLRFERNKGTLRVHWDETAPVTTSAGKEAGYGSRLLSLTIERQLKGRYSQTLTQDGLSFEFEIPVPHAS